MPAIHTTARPDALAALRVEVQAGRAYAVPVACATCDYGDEDDMVLVDRQAEQDRSTHPSGYVALSINDDPDEELRECPGCLEEILPDTVVLRDRRRRCATALDESTVRGLDLRVALNHGDRQHADALLRRAA